MLEATSFIDIKAAVLSFPPVTGLFADAVCAAYIGYFLACLNALEQVYPAPLEKWTTNKTS